MTDTEPNAVLDTDVLSFLFNNDRVRVPRYTRHIQSRTLYAAFASVAEIHFGAASRNWGHRRMSELERFLEQFTVIESNPEICLLWAQIRAHAQSLGRTIAPNDAWIAAAAVSLDIPLVTHNAAHFQHVPLLQVFTEPD